MVTLPVFDKTGNEVGKYEIDVDAIASRVSRQLLHDAVVMYQANRRQGSQHTKSRADVAGNKKKMYRQKGTGNARAGSKRTNVRRGGGHAFAVRNRDYRYRLPRKALRVAARMAFAGRLGSDSVIVVDELSMAQPKTSEMASLLRALKINEGSVLISTVAADLNVYRSARNIPGTSIVPVCDWNAFDLLRPRKVLVTREALDWVKQHWASGEFAAAEAEAEAAAGAAE